MSNEAHYYNRKNEYGKKPSRKKDKDHFPGQMSLEIDRDLLLITEDKNTHRNYTESEKKALRSYWIAFKDFLLASGVVARTYNLYKQAKIDQTVDVEAIKRELVSGNLSPDEYKRKRDQLRGIEKRQSVMIDYYKSLDVSVVAVKAEKDWDDYKKAFNTLIECAAKANIAFSFTEKQKITWMYKFAFYKYAYPGLNSKRQVYNGPKRREFYRTKYVNKALKEISEKGYSEPISLLDIEQEFKKWLKQNNADKKKRNHKTDSS